MFGKRRRREEEEREEKRREEKRRREKREEKKGRDQSLQGSWSGAGSPDGPFSVRSIVPSIENPELDLKRHDVRKPLWIIRHKHSQASGITFSSQCSSTILRNAIGGAKLLTITTYSWLLKCDRHQPDQDDDPRQCFMRGPRREITWLSLGSPDRVHQPDHDGGP